VVRFKKLVLDTAETYSANEHVYRVPANGIYRMTASLHAAGGRDSSNDTNTGANNNTCIAIARYPAWVRMAESCATTHHGAVVEAVLPLQEADVVAVVYQGRIASKAWGHQRGDPEGLRHARFSSELIMPVGDAAINEDDEDYVFDQE
jgi:hypothetical protein